MDLTLVADFCLQGDLGHGFDSKINLTRYTNSPPKGKRVCLLEVSLKVINY